MRASQPAIHGAMATAFAVITVTVCYALSLMYSVQYILSRYPVCYMVSCVERFVFVGRTVQPRWMT